MKPIESKETSAAPQKLPSAAKVTALKQAINIASDDGFADTKLAWFDGKKIKTHVQPSYARRGKVNITQQGRGLRAYETAGGKVFSVVDQAGEDTRMPNYHLSELNRAIVTDALVQAGFGGSTVRIGSTLPPGQFYRTDGSVNVELIEQKRANLMEVMKSTNGSPLAEIVEHEVFPEAIAAVVDHVYDDAGNMVVQLKSSIAVVDIGGQTTDIAVVRPDMTLDATRLVSRRIGVMNVHDKLMQIIGQHHSLDTREISALDLVGSLRTKRITVSGQDYDISEPLSEAVAEVGEEIIAEIQRVLRMGADLQAVLFVGGGASLMEEVVKTYPHALIHADPRFANARGVLKALTFLA